MAGVTLTFKRASAGAAFIVAGLSLVAGIYFPPSLLPDWIEWLSDVQPFTPAAELLRHLLLGTSMSGSVAVSLLTLVGFAVVMLPVAGLILNASIKHSRRNGTITEY